MINSLFHSLDTSNKSHTIAKVLVHFESNAYTIILWLKVSISYHTMHIHQTEMSRQLECFLLIIRLDQKLLSQSSAGLSMIQYLLSILFISLSAFLVKASTYNGLSWSSFNFLVSHLFFYLRLFLLFVFFYLLTQSVHFSKLFIELTCLHLNTCILHLDTISLTQAMFIWNSLAFVSFRLHNGNICSSVHAQNT